MSEKSLPSYQTLCAGLLEKENEEKTAQIENHQIQIKVNRVELCNYVQIKVIV